MIENKDQINILSQDQIILKERIADGKKAVEKLTKHKGQEIEKMIDRRVLRLRIEFKAEADGPSIGTSGRSNTTKESMVQQGVRRPSEQYVQRRFPRRVRFTLGRLSPSTDT